MVVHVHTARTLAALEAKVRAGVDFNSEITLTEDETLLLHRLLLALRRRNAKSLR